MARAPGDDGPRDALDAIRAAAVEIVTSAGDTDQLTLAAVADRAGVSEDVVVAHYPDVSQLVRDVLLRGFAKCLARMDRAVAALPAGATALDELRAIATGYVEFALEDQRTYDLTFGVRNAISTGLARVDEGTHPGAQALDTVIAGVEACRPDLGPGIARDRAISLWLALHGLIGLRSHRPLLELPPTERLIRTMVEAFVGSPSAGLRLVTEH